MILKDVRSANTQGGGSTSGSFQTRTLQTEVADPSGICTLSSNQFTLSAGDYKVWAAATIVGSAQCRTRIQNVTDGTTLVLSQSEYAGTGAGVNSISPQVVGTFTVAASKALELQSRVNTTRATDGYGVAANFGVNEEYAYVYLEKIA